MFDLSNGLDPMCAARWNEPLCEDGHKIFDFNCELLLLFRCISNFKGCIFKKIIRENQWSHFKFSPFFINGGIMFWSFHIVSNFSQWLIPLCNAPCCHLALKRLEPVAHRSFIPLQCFKVSPDNSYFYSHADVCFRSRISGKFCWTAKEIHTEF